MLNYPFKGGGMYWACTASICISSEWEGYKANGTIIRQRKLYDFSGLGQLMNGAVLQNRKYFFR